MPEQLMLSRNHTAETMLSSPPSQSLAQQSLVQPSIRGACQWLFLCHGKALSRLEKEQKNKNIGQNSVFLMTEGTHSSRSDLFVLDDIQNFPKWCAQSWAGIVTDETQAAFPEALLAELMRLKLQGTKIYQLEDFYNLHHKKIPPDCIQSKWLTCNFDSSLFSSQGSQLVKRVSDVVFSLMLIVLTMPIMLLTALAIKLDSPGPVLFHQTRTGLGQKPFQIHKFRSMRQDAERDGVQWAKTADNRITRVGKFVRAVRIDELPQLWNVLKGDMSLIGPRPERPEFDQKLRQDITYYDLRYSVKPGITGWAQVCYPYGASTEDAFHKLSYDIFYIKNYSLWLDVIVLMKTIKVVVWGKGR